MPLVVRAAQLQPVIVVTPRMNEGIGHCLPARTDGRRGLGFGIQLVKDDDAKRQQGGTCSGSGRCCIWKARARAPAHTIIAGRVVPVDPIAAKVIHPIIAREVYADRHWTEYGLDAKESARKARRLSRHGILRSEDE